MKRTIDPVERLRALVKQHGNQKKAAAAIGIGAVYFGDLLMGRKVFSDRVLASIGLERVVVAKRDVAA